MIVRVELFRDPRLRGRVYLDGTHIGNVPLERQSDKKRYRPAKVLSKLLPRSILYSLPDDFYLKLLTAKEGDIVEAEVK